MALKFTDLIVFNCFGSKFKCRDTGKLWIPLIMINLVSYLKMKFWGKIKERVKFLIEENKVEMSCLVDSRILMLNCKYFIKVSKGFNKEIGK